MFSFFRKKKPAPPTPEPTSTEADTAALSDALASVAPAAAPELSTDAEVNAQADAQQPSAASTPANAPELSLPPTSAALDEVTPPQPPSPNAAQAITPDQRNDEDETAGDTGGASNSAPEPTPPARQSWLGRLRQGLSKTGASISAVFVNAKIGDDLYDELEAALLSADVGVKATTHLLDELRRQVRAERAQTPEQVKALLRQGIARLLAPLQRSLVIGEQATTVLMVAGVNGAGKTTSIGKLTQHLSHHGATVLLAAADTFRAAAREQLSVWADRNAVEIVSQANADPAAVSYDAVRAGISRQRDVVIIDTAGRLPTQLHLMDELRKIKRVVTKAEASAPHEVLLVLDGNTGQNALAQVKAFDEALHLTGLIVTKLDGTAKGGVLAAIAMERPVPVYFIGVGEQLQDLQTFDADEFAQALLP